MKLSEVSTDGFIDPKVNSIDVILTAPQQSGQNVKLENATPISWPYDRFSPVLTSGVVTLKGTYRVEEVRRYFRPDHFR